MNLYSARAQEKRRQFDRLINNCDMVLMNNIPEVDPSVWENWEGEDPSDDCDVIDVVNADEQIMKNAPDEENYFCQEHEQYTTEGDYCDYRGDTAEVYQWFAVGDSDADFLKRHGQYITYSNMLDTYFLAITHFGTAWNYTSMVDDFADMYHDLDNFDDQKEVA